MLFLNFSLNLLMKVVEKKNFRVMDFSLKKYFAELQVKPGKKWSRVMMVLRIFLTQLVVIYFNLMELLQTPKSAK